MVILDTDIIVEFLRGGEAGLQKIREFKNLGAKLETTSINTFELFEGAFRKNDESSLLAVLNFLSNIDAVLSFDIVASRIAGSIMNRLKQNGTALDQSDVMIAAVAVREGKVLVSRNKKHFERIDGLKLGGW